MNLSDNGARFIAGHEIALAADGSIPARYLVPYNDPAGYATIGIGHLIAKRPVNDADRAQWGRLTQQQALDLYRSDLRRFIDAVAAVVTVPLTQNQFDALVSFDFNTGALKISTLLKKLNAGDYRGAADEFPKWNKAKDKKTGRLVVKRGLTRRRAEERATFLRTDASTPTVPVSAGQDIPRIPGESKEIAYMRAYLKASGVPHRVTSTVRSKLPSRHAQQGTDGQGLAIDGAGPQPGWNTPELLAVFKAFEPVEHLMYELIYSGAPYWIKRGKRLKPWSQKVTDTHWNHVHVSVNKGVFLPLPVTEEDDMFEENDRNNLQFTTDRAQETTNMLHGVNQRLDNIAALLEKLVAKANER